MRNILTMINLVKRGVDFLLNFFIFFSLFFIKILDKPNRLGYI